MKVVVIGGYGVFGAKLVRLLCRDEHDVTVAGRSLEKAQALADEVGAAALALDRTGSLSALWASSPDVVVDAAGPFHAYGDDPYGLVRECVKQGVHYLDLADDPAFCAGITTLDEAAKAAGVFALSGVSSVPAISSAAVTALADGALEVNTISSAILPGNRAPRGKAVVESILHQCGLPFDVVMDGERVPVRSWSRPERFDLGGGMIRPGWMIEVPDHRLFQQAFGARTVLFRAGLELGVMNWGLAAFSWLRGRIRFGIGDWFVRLLLWAAKLLWPFGTDEGGMCVAIVARYPGGWKRRTWRMVARAGEGPFIPAVAARVVLRDPGAIARGARPAVAVVSLDAVAKGLADLAVETEVLEEALEPIFPAYLGDDFATLPETVQQAHLVHGPRRWAGRASVTRGRSLWSRLLAWAVGFPQTTDDIAVTVAMTPGDSDEMWERKFGGQVFRSHLRLKDGCLTERFGPATFTLGLYVEDGQLHFPVTGGRIGPIPLPRFVLPRSVSREYEADGRFHFDVALMAPLTGGLMVHYRGWLVRAMD